MGYSEDKIDRIVAENEELKRRMAKQQAETNSQPVKLLTLEQALLHTLNTEKSRIYVVDKQKKTVEWLECCRMGELVKRKKSKVFLCEALEDENDGK